MRRRTANVRAFFRPGALRASFDDYRAMHQDIALDDNDAAEGRRLTVSVLALHPGVSARGTDGASARLSGRQDRSSEMSEGDDAAASVECMRGLLHDADQPAPSSSPLPQGFSVGDR